MTGNSLVRLAPPIEVFVPDKSVLAAHRNRLGKEPDQKIADQAGVSRTLVVNYRKKLGIPAYQGHKGAVPATKPMAAPLDDRPFRGRRSALDPFRHQLGTVPDAEIARLAGVTAENVRTYRQRRLIAPAWQSGDAPPAPPEVHAVVSAPAHNAPAATRPLHPAPAIDREPRHKKPRVFEAAPLGAAARETDAETLAMPAAVTNGDLGAGTAFLVLVDTEQGPRSYALLAPDIAVAAAEAAARVPTRHPDGTIRAIQRVAELLPG